jgi:hypothetical protein
MVRWIKGGIPQKEWELVEEYLKRERMSKYGLVQRAVLAYVKGEKAEPRHEAGIPTGRVEDLIAALPPTPNVGRETAKICAEEAFRILLDRTLDSGEIVASVAERTGLKSPRKAITEVLRAYREAGIVVGGGKGSTKYRMAERK